MDHSTLTALSPLDGRYANRSTPLRPFLSEFALIRYRTLIEVRWLQLLADDPGIIGLSPLGSPVKDVLNALIDEFGIEDARRVKALEATTNHDVKAVEYFLREKLEGVAGSAPNIIAYLHFACTSEDINNLSYALMLRDTRRRILIPAMKSLISELRNTAHRFADVAMLSRTHGQPATPTTLGKELANFVHRLDTQLATFRDLDIYGKINGAVGNYNAHLAACPNVDWPSLGARFVSSLDLVHQPYSTQIEPHDWIAAYCHSLMRFNSILTDLCRDIWGYVSLGYFRQRANASEVGSSTMPHKVNPIDFENAEGNLGMANAVLGFLADKLPISRWQRDLTDSTVLRNLGVGVGHTLVAIDACQRGLGKLEADQQRIAADLDNSWEVLGEAVQTVMRCHGISDAYEQLKAVTRGRQITRDTLQEFIRGLELPDHERARLLALTPGDYVGLAAQLARQV